MLKLKKELLPLKLIKLIKFFFDIIKPIPKELCILLKT